MEKSTSLRYYQHLSSNDNFNQSYHIGNPSDYSIELWKKAYLRVKSKIMYTKMTETYSPLTQTVRLTRKSIVHVKMSMPYLILHPNSRVKFVWNCVLIILLIYTATITPFRICFIDSIVYSSWWWADTLIDILFAVDIIINLNSAFYNEDNQLETSRKYIFLNYLKTWMFLDICALLPYHIFQSNPTSSSSSSKLIKMIRLLRLYRLFKIYHLIKQFKNAGNSEEPQMIKEGFVINEALKHLIKFSLKTLIAIHVISCFWYFSAKIQDFEPNTWVVRMNFEEYSLGQLYLRSFYWAFTTLSTVGYGDIHPENNAEMLIAIAWMLFGICFFSYTLGILSSMLLSQNTKEIALNKKLLAVDEFIKEEKLPVRLKREMKEALKYSNEKNGFSWADKQGILNELPAELRYEVAIKMHSGAILNISYFMEKDKVFIAAIVPFLGNIHGKKGDYVYKEGDYASDIYFIIIGHVTLMCTDIPIKSWKSGKYFGDIEVMEKTTRDYSVYCAASSQLLVMSKDVINFIHNEFPEYSNDMLITAKLKKERLDNLKRKIQIFTRIRDLGLTKGRSAEKIKALIQNEIKIENFIIGNRKERANLGNFLKSILEIDQNIAKAEKKLTLALEKTEKILSKY